MESGTLAASALTIKYGINKMPDISTDVMYRNVSVKGNIYTIPEVPELAVSASTLATNRSLKPWAPSMVCSKLSWISCLELPYIYLRLDPGKRSMSSK